MLSFAQSLRAHGARLPAGGILLGVFLALYIYHAAPDVTWGDSGEFASVARTLGIAHPTGYPLYTLIGRVLTGVLPFTPARALNLFSALCSALSIALVYQVILLIFREMRQDKETADPTPVWQEIACAAIGAITLGICPMFLMHAFITEVYALGSLFQLALWREVLAWRQGQGSLKKWFFILGLAFAHHLTILILVPFMLLLILHGLRQSGRNQKEFATALPYVLPGILLYLYIPLRAAMAPVINWGDPSSLEGFLWTVQGGDFRGFFQFDPLVHYGIPYLIFLAGEHLLRLGQQFPLFWLFMAASGAGSINLMLQRKTHHRSAFLLGILLLAMGFSVFYVSFYQVGDREVFFLAAYPLTAILIGVGMGFCLELLRKEIPAAAQRMNWKQGKAVATVSTVFLLLACVAILLRQGYYHLERWSAREDRGALVYGETIIEALPPGSLLLVGLQQSRTDNALYPLWYQKWALGKGEDVVIVGANFFNSPWYRFQIPQGTAWFPERRDFESRRLVVDIPGTGTTFVSRAAYIEAIALFLRQNLPLRELYTVCFAPELLGEFQIEPVLIAPTPPGATSIDYWMHIPEGNLFRVTPRHATDNTLLQESPE